MNFSVDFNSDGGCDQFGYSRITERSFHRWSVRINDKKFTERCTAVGSTVTIDLLQHEKAIASENQQFIERYFARNVAQYHNDAAIAATTPIAFQSRHLDKVVGTIERQK